MEPTLLLPIGFGTILVNIPLTGVITQEYMHGDEIGVISLLFDSGIGNELFPLLLFIGIGAMIDFEPLLTNPKLFLFGAAAQFGIFFTLSMARLFGFDLHDAAPFRSSARRTAPPPSSWPRNSPPNCWRP